MNYLDNYRTYARYNEWMNTRLMARCDELSDADRKLDRGAFFGSIHGTWNHLLVADRLWLARFRERAFPFVSLDQELCSDHVELKQERARTDSEIIAYVAGLKESDLDTVVAYVGAVTGRRHRFRLGDCLQHFFNHQTHHRGQITALISQAGANVGVTDLIWLPGLEL